jgi:hypothetical protein
MYGSVVIYFCQVDVISSVLALLKIEGLTFCLEPMAYRQDRHCVFIEPNISPKAAKSVRIEMSACRAKIMLCWSCLSKALPYGRGHLASILAPCLESCAGAELWRAHKQGLSLVAIGHSYRTGHLGESFGKGYGRQPAELPPVLFDLRRL